MFQMIHPSEVHLSFAKRVMMVMDYLLRNAEWSASVDKTANITWSLAEDKSHTSVGSLLWKPLSSLRSPGKSTCGQSVEDSPWGFQGESGEA